jgi:hypothetical protein
MAVPIPGVVYGYDAVSAQWIAPGRPSLTGTTSISDAYADTYSDTY